MDEICHGTYLVSGSMHDAFVYTPYMLEEIGNCGVKIRAKAGHSAVAIPRSMFHDI